MIAREGKGLTRHRFVQVLRLIALAQSRFAFTPENTAAALHASSWLALHGVPLPPPRIGSALQQAAAAAVEVQQAQQTQQTPQRAQQDAAHQAAQQAAPHGSSLVEGDGDLMGSEGSGPAPAAPPPPATVVATAAAAAPLLSTADDDDDLFGLKTLQQRAASHGAAATSSTGEVAAVGQAAAGTEARAAFADRRLSRSLGVSSHSGSNRGFMRVHTGAWEGDDEGGGLCVCGGGGVGRGGVSRGLHLMGLLLVAWWTVQRRMAATAPFPGEQCSRCTHPPPPQPPWSPPLHSRRACRLCSPRCLPSSPCWRRPMALCLRDLRLAAACCIGGGRRATCGDPRMCRRKPSRAARWVGWGGGRAAGKPSACGTGGGAWRAPVLPGGRSTCSAGELLLGCAGPGGQHAGRNLPGLHALHTPRLNPPAPGPATPPSSPGPTAWPG